MITSDDVAYIRQNDTSPTADIICKDNDGNVVPVTGATVIFRMKKVRSDTLKVESAGSVVDGAAGHIRYAWVTGDTDTPGRYECEFQVTFSDGSIETFRNGENNLKIQITPELG